MSLDISLVGPMLKITEDCPHCGREYVKSYREEFYTDNITHNLAPMAKAAGLHGPVWRPEENNIKCARDMIVILENGIRELQTHSSEYKKLNPENNWGSYGNLLTFLINYLDACRAHPDAEIEACR